MKKHENYTTQIITASLIFILFSGCGLLQSHRDAQWVKDARKENLDPRHLYSCGPEALKEAFDRLGIDVSQTDLSREIQENGTCLRDFLAVFDIRARQITFPHEMRTALGKYGYKMTKIDSLKKINVQKDTAILLVHKINTLSYHWLCYPVSNFHFFGKETILDSVYLIEKIL